MHCELDISCGADEAESLVSFLHIETTEKYSNANGYMARELSSDVLEALHTCSTHWPWRFSLLSRL